MKKPNSPSKSKELKTKRKVRKPSGHSRAAQNKKIRRDALREELKSREYIRQLSEIEQRLNPDHKKTFNTEDIPKIRERTGILFKLLDKCLPNLRPVDIPIVVSQKTSLIDKSEEIIDAMAKGKISSQEASGFMSAITAHLRVVEADDLIQRIEELERKNL